MEINKQTAKRMFPDAPEWLKKQLIEEFGESTFIAKDFETIKTFEDACRKLSLDPESVTTSADTSDEAAYKKLKVVIKAVNGSWIPDWNNDGQRKWYPWFNLYSGFGFSASTYDWASTATGVGSRLCFETEEQCTYTANQFIDLYREFLTITK